jgi:hypothetical protein
VAGGYSVVSMAAMTVCDSVAELGCLSLIPDPNVVHPGSRIRIFPSRIPDPHQII